MKIQHGGDLYGAGLSFKGEILDFSVNINPLGAPKQVLAAAAAALQQAEQYPDPECRDLRNAIGQLHHVPQKWILCGNGASEIIFRIAQGLRPGSALVAVPCFLEYEAALQSVGCQIHRHLLQEDRQFDVGVDLIQAITPQIGLVMLCSPNNPTGRCIAPEVMEQIAARCRETGSVLMIDECFLPLTDGGEGFLPLLKANDNVILLRAFTKSHGIPGLRIGYCLCSNPDLLRQLEQAGPGWSVSCVAQAAGMACCLAEEWPELGRRMIETERPFLQKALWNMGFRVIESNTGFVLFRKTGDDTLKQRLLQQGILIRSCDNYSNLGPDWYRVAVKNHRQNMILLEAIKKNL